MPTQIYQMKCPFDGWVRRITLNIEGNNVEVVKGLNENIETFIKSYRNRQECDSWSDIPACPKCDTPYQYNWKTGETRS